MGSFITDGATVLPVVKSDDRPAFSPPKADEWASQDANAIRQALLDLRSYAQGYVTGFVNPNAALVTASGGPQKALQDWMATGPVDTSAATITATGTTAARTAAARFGEVVNLKDFGAVGDGAANDTTPIANWLAASPTSQHVAPPGNYKYTAAITLSGSRLLDGTGGISGATTFTYTGAGTALTLTGYGNRVRGIKIVASAATTGLKLLDAIYNRVEDINITGPTNQGIFLTSANVNAGCGWNEFVKMSVLAATPLSLDKGTGWVNQNKFSDGVLRSSASTGGITIFINGANSNLFSGLDPSWYGTPYAAPVGQPGIAVDVQGGANDLTFLNCYIDSNTNGTGYFIAAGASGIRVIGGVNGAGTQYTDLSTALDNVFQWLDGFNPSRYTAIMGNRAPLFLQARGGDSEVVNFRDSGGNKKAAVTTGGVFCTESGGSTTISTGTGTVKMSTANSANSVVWIPFRYNGTFYFIPGWATNAP